MTISFSDWIELHQKLNRIEEKIDDILNAITEPENELQDTKPQIDGPRKKTEY